MLRYLDTPVTQYRAQHGVHPDTPVTLYSVSCYSTYFEKLLWHTCEIVLCGIACCVPWHICTGVTKSDLVSSYRWITQDRAHLINYSHPWFLPYNLRNSNVNSKQFFDSVSKEPCYTVPKKMYVFMHKTQVKVHTVIKKPLCPCWPMMYSNGSFIYKTLLVITFI